MNTKTKNIALRYLLWVLVVAVMIFIFIHSAQNAKQSSETSGELVKTVLTVVVKDFQSLPEPEQQQAVDSLQFIVRKSAHFCIYLALGFLCFLAMNTYNIKKKTKILTSLTISLLYAISDEIHQIFVPGRAGQVRDVLIDFSGSLTGVVFALILIAIISKIVKKKEEVSYEEERAYK